MSSIKKTSSDENQWKVFFGKPRNVIIILIIISIFVILINLDAIESALFHLLHIIEGLIMDFINWIITKIVNSLMVLFFIFLGGMFLMKIVKKM